MTKLEKIEKEVQSLSAEELAAFRAWFLTHDAGQWDRQFEQDAQAGKLEHLRQTALEEHQAGRIRQL